MSGIKDQYIESLAASKVVVTPSGNLAADDAAEAFNELQGDIDGLGTAITDGDQDVSDTLQGLLIAHAADTATHGVSVAIVGTTETQTLTNKTLTAAAITATSLDVSAAGSKTVFGSVGANNLTIGGSSTTVVIAGNLQVDGTTVTVNTTTLDVEDKNITLSKGANDAASEGAGLTVDRTSTDGSLIYKNASATKWAAGDLGSEVDLVGTSSTQTLTNKTIVAANNTITTAASGNLTETSLNTALAELQGDIDTLARGTADGRLTVETGVPVSTSDQTGKSTIYYTPFAGSRIGLYDGTRWGLHTFTERSLALSGLTSGLNYDVFLYNNAGTLTLELTAWTNDTTRATALTLQDGVYVKSGVTTRRWLGTIRTTSTTATEDSVTKRFVYNHYNRWPRRLFKFDGTSHSYNTATIRYWNGDATNRVECVLGEPQTMLANAAGSLTTSTSSGATLGAMLGIGDNAVAGNAVLEPPFSTTFGIPFAHVYQGITGFQFIALVERGTGVATTSFFYGLIEATILC